MAIRATNKDQFATKMQFVVETASTVTAGRAVVCGNADGEALNAGADSDLAIGIALTSGTAGQKVDVALFGPVIPVLVGTGGATRGTKMILVADGVTDAPAHDSDGTGNEAIYGIFIESGVAGDTVGAILSGASNRGS